MYVIYKDFNMLTGHLSTPFFDAFCQHCQRHLSTPFAYAIRLCYLTMPFDYAIWLCRLAMPFDYAV